MSVYIPPPPKKKSVYLTNLCVVTGCFFFSLTQDKFDIVPVCALARVSFTYYTPKFIPPPPNEITGYAPRHYRTGGDKMLV